MILKGTPLLTPVARALKEKEQRFKNTQVSQNQGKPNQTINQFKKTEMIANKHKGYVGRSWTKHLLKYHPCYQRGKLSFPEVKVQVT